MKSLLQVLPFAAILLAIAVLPLSSHMAHWWEKNSNKFVVACVCALAGILIYYSNTHEFSKILHTYLEYIAFIALLAALFIVSGGIHISGAFAGFPYINTIFLGIGALLANLMGTTGASMVLIRPLLRANRLRKNKTHIIIFFIFIVSNAGGCLTPLGDPPLYLGFLRGVPFDWTLRLFPQWMLVNVLLLFIFHIIDERIFDSEDLATKASLVDEVAKAKKKIHVEGWQNIFLLVLIVLVILAAGSWVYPVLAHYRDEHQADLLSKVFQILAFLCISGASYWTTNAKIHQENRFSFGPIQEVAALFFGIFGAMIPALALLESKGQSLSITQPWQYFWMTGALSSFLDNAPTYLTYVTLAAAQKGVSTHHLGELASQFPAFLAAISCGAVFMGANTYIGNGPNFMVKAIAEHGGIQMPSFLGYMKWSCGILIPIFVILTFIFF